MASAPLNLARFDLVSIRLAAACAQTGSLSAAARASHLALAAASRRVRELEESLGSPLFERHARGLHPTPAGKVFLRHALDLLQSMERMGAEITDLRQGVARHVRLWSSTAAIQQFLPPLLARYHLLHPEVRIDLEEQVSEAVAAALRDGRADAGIFVDGTEASGLQTRAFAQDELVLVVPARHPLARGKAPLAFADTLDQDYVGLSSGAAVLGRQQQAAAAAGRTLQLRVQVRSLDAVCHMVSHGVGIALLPRATAEPWLRRLGLAMRPLSDDWARRRMLVAMRSGQEDAGVHALVEFLAGQAGQLSQTAKSTRRTKQ